MLGWIKPVSNNQRGVNYERCKEILKKSYKIKIGVAWKPRDWVQGQDLEQIFLIEHARSMFCLL